jgi:hypothetical protein
MARKRRSYRKPTTVDHKWSVSVVNQIVKGMIAASEIHRHFTVDGVQGGDILNDTRVKPAIRDGSYGELGADVFDYVVELCEAKATTVYPDGSVVALLSEEFFKRMQGGVSALSEAGDLLNTAVSTATGGFVDADNTGSMTQKVADGMATLLGV